LEVVRHDQVRVQAELQAGDVDPGGRQLVHLLQQHCRIHDDAVGDHRGDVRIQDPAGNEVELEQPPLGDDRVARVVPALITDHEIHPVGEVVDRLALALVTPLGPEYDRGRHGTLSLRDGAQALAGPIRANGSEVAVAGTVCAHGEGADVAHRRTPAN